MSKLEVDFDRVMFGKPRAGEIGPAEQIIIARWFSKTAVVLNSSQNYRVLVPADERHALAAGTVPGFDVYLAKLTGGSGKLEFRQGAEGAFLFPTDQVESGEARRRFESLYSCAIRVEDVVGVIVYAPPDHWAEPDTKVRHVWPLDGRELNWEDLPVISDMLELGFLTVKESWRAAHGLGSVVD